MTAGERAYRLWCDARMALVTQTGPDPRLPMWQELPPHERQILEDMARRLLGEGAQPDLDDRALPREQTADCALLLLEAWAAGAELRSHEEADAVRRAVGSVRDVLAMAKGPRRPGT